jgi:hypothetical protein
MAGTYTRVVYLSIFEKGSIRIFPCKNGWCWEAITVGTVEGTPVKRGPFPTRDAARKDKKKYAEETLRKRR